MEPVPVTTLVALISTLLGGTFFEWLRSLLLRGAEPTVDQIREAEQDAAGALDALPEAAPRPPSARAEAQGILRQYAIDLDQEACRIAKRAGADQPSAAHVRIAADRVGILRKRSGAVADIGLAAGSLLAGSAISYWVNLQTGGTAKPGSETYAVIVLSLGVALLTGAGTAKWKDR
ncbi:MAG TPA: hypothetical protein VFP72_04450 [Kineosporiaceae bacterium]|nr:hypothetical protein [Kineosporiaceae bacterium]